MTKQTDRMYRDIPRAYREGQKAERLRLRAHRYKVFKELFDDERASLSQNNLLSIVLKRLDEGDNQ